MFSHQYTVPLNKYLGRRNNTNKTIVVTKTKTTLHSVRGFIEVVSDITCNSTVKAALCNQKQLGLFF